MATSRSSLILMAVLGSTWLLALYYWQYSSSLFYSNVESFHNRQCSNDNHNANSSSPPPEWFLSYVQWHGQQLRKNASKYYYFQYKCGGLGDCGGIGDRLNGIVTSFYTALCNDRVFLIDHASPYPLTTTFRPRRMLWNIRAPKSENVVGFFLHDDRQHPILREPAELQENEAYRKARGISASISQWMQDTLPSSTCLQKYIQRHENNRSVASNDSFVILDPDDLYRWAFHALFDIADPLSKRIQQIQKRAGLLGPTDHSQGDNTTFAPENHCAVQPYVAMHVRTGINPNFEDPVRHAGNETFWKFLHCAKHMQRQLAAQITMAPTNKTTMKTLLMGGDVNDTSLLSSASSSLPLIFVASDNMAAKQQFEEWDNTSIRFDHELTVVHIDRTRDQPLDSYLDAWAEFVMLWQANMLVMSNSGYSRMASKVGHFTNVTARYFDACDDDSL